MEYNNYICNQNQYEEEFFKKVWRKVQQILICCELRPRLESS